jgi:hypothetical protein
MTTACGYIEIGSGAVVMPNPNANIEAGTTEGKDNLSHDVSTLIIGQKSALKDKLSSSPDVGGDSDSQSITVNYPKQKKLKVCNSYAS